MFFRIVILKFFKFGIEILVFLSSNAKLLRNRKKNVRFDKQCLNFWLLQWTNKFSFREKKAFFPCDFFDIPSHRHLYGFLLSQKTDHTNGGDHTIFTYYCEKFSLRYEIKMLSDFVIKCAEGLRKSEKGSSTWFGSSARRNLA